MSEQKEITAQEIIGVLRKLAQAYPQAVYPFDRYADFVDDQQRLIDRYDDALKLAAEEFEQELIKLTPDDVEVALPSEFIADWKEKAGIPLDKE